MAEKSVQIKALLDAQSNRRRQLIKLELSEQLGKPLGRISDSLLIEKLLEAYAKNNLEKAA